MTNDSGFVFGGWTQSRASSEKSEDNRGETDFWLIATDSLGNPRWDRTLGGNRRDELACMVKAHNGDIVAGGISNSTGSQVLGERQERNRGLFDYWLLRLDSTGAIVWEFAAGHTGDDLIHVVTPTRDGGFLLGGWSNSGQGSEKSEPSRGDFDYWIVKIDSAGRQLWDRTYGGNGRDELRAIVELDNGDLIIGGNSESPISGDRNSASRGGADYWVIRTDSLGTILWERAYGGTAHDRLRAALVTPEGNVLLGGFSSSGRNGDKSDASRGGDDYWVIEIDTTGTLLWDRTYGSNSEDQCWAMAPALEGGYLLSGWSKSQARNERTDDSRGAADYWILKIDETGRIVWDRALGSNSDDYIKCILPVREGRYMVPGFSASAAGFDRSDRNRGTSYDYWVVMLRDMDVIPTSRTANEVADRLFTVYPNPSAGRFTVEATDVAFNDGTLTVLDVLGRPIVRQAIENGRADLDLQAQPAGVYQIKIEAEGRCSHERLILSR